jgi:hypothetical protein
MPPCPLTGTVAGPFSSAAGDPVSVSLYLQTDPTLVINPYP